MTLSIKKKTLRKVVSSLTMLATVVSMSGIMALSSVSIASAAVADGAIIKSNATNPDGTPTIGSLDVYIVKLVGTKMFKRLILNPTVFTSYGRLNWGNIQTVSQAVMDEYTTSALVRVDTDPAEKVFAMAPNGDIGSKSWVNLTSTQFLGVTGSDADAIYTINAVDGGNYTAVGDVTTTAELTTFYTTGVLPGVVPVPAGGLTVSLSANTPASATIPSNATGAVFTKVNFTASSEGAATVTGLTVKRTGVGATTDISKLYLYDGATRLTTGKTVSSSTNEAIFTNLSVSIAAGTTKTLSIVGDIANSVSGQHAFGIASASSITGIATVSGSFPVTGNAMQLSTTTVGKADVEATTTTYTRKVGETNVEVGNFTVYVNSTENAQFKGITLYNSGRDVLSNVKVYRGSDLVGIAVKSGSNFIITLDTPYAIDKSQSAIFTVKADIGGRNADTATLYVRYNTDVVVTGNTYGYNLGIDATLGGGANSYIEEADSSPLTNVTTVEAGQLTITTSGPNTANVSKNTNNVVLLNFAINSQATVDVSKFTVTIVGNGTNLVTGDIDNLDLIIDGVTVGTKSAVTVGDNVFTDTFTLLGGKTTQGQIIVDINNTATGNETIAATIKDMTSTTNFLAKTSDGDTVSDIIPSGDIDGKTMTVTTASLTLDRASSPASAQTYVGGTNDAAITGFAFKAGSAVDVKVTSVKLTAFMDDDQSGFDDGDLTQLSGAKSVMSAVGLYDGATPVASKKALTVGTAFITVTFDGLNLAIPKGTTKTLVAKADLSTAANNYNVAMTIYAAGDVVSEYGSGTNLVPTLSTNNNTPTIYQIVASSGTLTMASDSNTPSTNLVVAGSDNVEYTKFKFTSTKEAFKVTKLEIKNSANDSNFTGVTLSYKDATDATKTAAGSLIGGVADFTFAAGDEIYVPKDASAIVTIKGNLNTISGGATNSNASHLDADVDTNFEAIGVSSSEKITNAAGGSSLGVQTITVGGTELAGGKDPAAANVVVPTPTGTTNISVDVADGASNIAIATAIAAAIDADANWTAISSGTLVVATAASYGAWANTAIVTTALIAVIDGADLTASDTTLAVASSVTGSGADGVGASMALYESVPTVSFTTDTPSGNLIPSVSTLVAKIKFAASATKDVTFSATGAANNALVLKIAATGAGLTADDDVVTLKDKNGNTLCTDTINLGTDVANCDFASRDLIVAAGTEEIVSVYLDTTELATAGNSVQVWLDDAADANLIWSIDGNLANYSTGTITFRGDKYAGSLVKP